MCPADRTGGAAIDDRLLTISKVFGFDTAPLVMDTPSRYCGTQGRGGVETCLQPRGAVQLKSHLLQHSLQLSIFLGKTLSLPFNHEFVKQCFVKPALEACQLGELRFVHIDVRQGQLQQAGLGQLNIVEFTHRKWGNLHKHSMHFNITGWAR
jgi:hypothetical protein